MKSMKKTIWILALLIPAFTGCNDWLDVSSKTEIPSDEHFSSETGFKDAVIGVYVKMSKPELYGKALTWHVNEFVSQNYARVSAAPDLNVLDLLYDRAPFISYGNSIWKNCYETIELRREKPLGHRPCGGFFGTGRDAGIKSFVTFRSVAHVRQREFR